VPDTRGLLLFQVNGSNGATSTGKIKVSDCVCDPLSIELEGDCQNRIIDVQAGVDTGINYLKASVTGGFGLSQGFEPICT
jgi:hypothetical protein